MERRTFLRGTAGLVAGVGLAGCSSASAAPPRRAEAFQDVSLSGSTMEIALESDPEVETRTTSGGGAATVGVADSLSPVGVARAQKGAGNRGSGGYSGAPRHSRHRNWAVWHGGGYTDDWRDEHRDEVRMADADVVTVGVAYLGTDEEYQADAPGPGPVPWDREWDDPEEGATLSADLASLSPDSDVRSGWYRVGTEFRAERGAVDPNWQAVDFEVNTGSEPEIDRVWYVAPRV